MAQTHIKIILIYFLLLFSECKTMAQCPYLYSNPQDSLVYIDSNYKILANCMTFTSFGGESKGGFENTFVNGKIVMQKCKYENGTIKYQIHFDSRGKIKDDSVVYYFDNNKIQKIDFYKMGVLNASKEYDLRTGKIIREKKPLKNGITIDNVYDYTNNRPVDQIITTQDSCDFIYHTPINNQPTSIESLKNGQRNGIYIEFNSNGTTSLIETYVSGKKNGWCIYYTEVGEFKQRAFYEDGLLIKVEK